MVAAEWRAENHARVNGLQRSALIRAYISVPFPDFTFGQYLREAIWIVFYGRVFCPDLRRQSRTILPLHRSYCRSGGGMDDIADGGVQLQC